MRGPLGSFSTLHKAAPALAASGRKSRNNMKTHDASVVLLRRSAGEVFAGEISTRHQIIYLGPSLSSHVQIVLSLAASQNPSQPRSKQPRHAHAFAFPRPPTSPSHLIPPQSYIPSHHFYKLHRPADHTPYSHGSPAQRSPRHYKT